MSTKLLLCHFIPTLQQAVATSNLAIKVPWLCSVMPSMKESYVTFCTVNGTLGYAVDIMCPGRDDMLCTGLNAICQAGNYLGSLQTC